MDTDRLLSHLRRIQERLLALAETVGSWCAREPWRRTILFLVAFSPAIIAGYWISQCAVNVPAWDGWERGALLQKAHGEDGQKLDFEYLSSAHIDHRPLVPRLFTLAASAASGGDVRVEIWIGFLAIVAGAIGLFGART